MDKIDDVRDELMQQQNAVVELKAELNSQSIFLKRILSDIERIDRRVDELYGRNEKMLIMLSENNKPSVRVEAGLRIDSIDKAGDIIGNDKRTTE
jgi:hypothetical protein